MSIASEVARINSNISDSYAACLNKGASIPQTQNSDNLPSTINSIQLTKVIELSVFSDGSFSGYISNSITYKEFFDAASSGGAVVFAKRTQGSDELYRIFNVIELVKGSSGYQVSVAVIDGMKNISIYKGSGSAKDTIALDYFSV